MFKKNFFIQLILFMYVGIIATSCDDGGHGGGAPGAGADSLG